MTVQIEGQKRSALEVKWLFQLHVDACILEPAGS